MLSRLLGTGRSAGESGAAPALSPLLEDVARPIAGDSPCGSDVSYEAEFLRLREEIDRLNAVDTRVDQEKATELARGLKANGRRPSGSGESRGNGDGARVPSGIDVELVISLARGILAEKSKDLRVVSYLALGLARRDGLRGLAEGVQALDLLVQSFWDGLFPPPARMTGRKYAVEVGVRWLVESIEGVAPTHADREALERARRALESLGAAFAMRELPDLVAHVGMLQAKVGELIGRVPAAPPTPAAAPVAATPRTSESVPRRPAAGAPGTTFQEVANLPQSAAQAAELVVRGAAWLRKEDPGRAASYRLLRALRWDVLVREPPNEQRRTAIEAPPAGRRDYLAGLHARAAWAELLREGESAFAQSPFHVWLDLQRLIVDALDALGAEYAPAKDTVVRELQLLIARIPSLPTLRFADGRTPFADPGTMSWLEELARSWSAAGTPARGGAPAGRSGGVAGTGTAPLAARLAARFTEPRKRFNGGDLAGALAQLHRGESEDASRHDWFLRRLYAGMLSAEAGQLAVARALLEELDQEIAAHRLESWDPELALEVWTRLHACYAALLGRVARGGDAHRVVIEMERVFARICCVDPTRALGAAREVAHPK